MAPGRAFARDFSASFLVFLVALPLCLGISLASGVPPARGIVTGIVGGLIPGSLAGSPLAVSGPAAGLTVLVFQLVSQHGLAALGPIVLAAGALQVLAGVARIGDHVQSIPPAIVEGLLAAIGLILIAAQCHVMIGTAPAASFIANLADVAAGLRAANLAALMLGMLTITVLLLWERWCPVALNRIPPALVGVVAATLVAWGGGLAVAHVELPASLADAVALMRPQLLWQLASPGMLVSAFSVAMIASIESLLSAAAIDRMTPHRKRSDYSRELMAQGAGNIACGFLGALPMTGVIVRSAANVRAGARTRLSTILHGVWLLALVVVLPGALRLIPTASLAGLLVLVGVRLVDVQHLRRLMRDGWQQIAIYGSTVGVTLCTNLVIGVMTGLAVHAAALAIRWVSTRPA